MKQHYIITYDLRSQDMDYTRLVASIKSYSSWVHPLERVWCIYTDKDAGIIYDELKVYINPSADRLLIMRMPDLDKVAIQGWLGSNFWTWLTNTNI